MSKKTILDNKIKNGHVSVRGWDINIAIAPSGDVRPVMLSHRDCSGTLGGTFQQVMSGDLVFSSTWKRKSGRQLYVSEYRDGVCTMLPSERGQQAWKWLYTTPLHEQIMTFLTNGRVLWDHPVFLPAGLGWDGVNSISDIYKKDRIIRFFNGLPAETINKIVDMARVSASHYLPTAWKHAVPKLPPRLLFTYDDPKMTQLGVIISWVVWTGNNEVIHIEESTAESYGKHGCQVPRGAIRAARLCWNYRKANSGTPGIYWTLFLSK